MNSGLRSTPPDECETCGNPDGVLCDECALEEHLGDIERAEGLRSTPPGSLFPLTYRRGL